MKMFRVVINGSEYKVGIEELADENIAPSSPAKTSPAPVARKPEQASSAQQKHVTSKVEPAVLGGTIVAPMPGTVLQVAVNLGDKVTKGQTLVILEAMKMENEIMAPTDGVVHELNVSQGASVNAGDILVVLS